MEKVKKNKVIRAWVNQHITDHYVHLATKDGYRSRAAYKLLAIDAQDKLFNNGLTVVDLGCAPGSWSQIAINKVGINGRVIGVDLLAIQPLNGLNFIHGDFTQEEVLQQLVKLIKDKPIDLVLSDMAPNLSGIKGVDQARSSQLVALALDFAKHHLKPGGNCLIKVFQGGEFTSLVKLAREIFTQVLIRKPDASRQKSSETYLLGKNKKA